jgi:hypothetical protein
MTLTACMTAFRPMALIGPCPALRGRFAPASVLVVLLMLMLLAPWPAALAQASGARTALIIGISRYADPAVTPLRGVEHDMASARTIARAMGVPENGMRVVRNAEATKAGLLAILRDFGERTREGTRALVYFSGHGTRYFDPEAGGCVEGLLTYDGQVITNAELAQATQAVGQRADKLVVMLDACHSEGVLPAKGAETRGLASALVPKFSTGPASGSAAACSVVSNYRTRGLFTESTRLGALRENVVLITSARPDEVSFDDPNNGGLATVGIRDCLLGKARDLDASGAVSLEEIRRCAQSFVTERLRAYPHLAPHTISLSGNRNLVPVPVSRPPVAGAAPVQAARPAESAAPAPIASALAATSPVQQPTAPVAAPASVQVSAPVAAPASVQVSAPVAAPASVQVSAPVATPAPAPAPPPSVVQPSVPVAPPVQAPAPAPAPPPPALASLATLADIAAQADPRRMPEVSGQAGALRIGRDFLELTVTPQRDGFLYLVLLGSDARSFYLLFPNALDMSNRVRAGQPVRLPREDWRIRAAGPAGINHLMVVVADTPRSLERLTRVKPDARSPFTFTLNTLDGRSALFDFLTSAPAGGTESFGARLLTVEEVR